MAKPLKVGLQLSIGGLGDLSFNDSAYYGLEQAQQAFGIEFETAAWENPISNADNMEGWAKAGFDLIIAVGYGNAAADSCAAKGFSFHENSGNIIGLSTGGRCNGLGQFFDNPCFMG